MQSTRKLAAIMFTDIQGYTSLMQEDEAKALEMRNRHREVFQRLHKKFNGTILQYYGDGTLSVFDSAIDAAQCGVAMQQELQAAPKVPLRIGIHTGDILYSDTEAIGDGVNVASRVESVAVPGSVMISDKVYDYIKNQKGIPVQSMGMFNFKNVEKPFEVYALGLEGLVVPNPASLTGKFEKRTNNQNLQTGIWAKAMAHKKFIIPAAIILLAGLLWFALSNSGTGNTNSAFTTLKVKDEYGNIIEKQIVSSTHQKKIYIVDFENTAQDKETDWIGMAIPFALEIDWDQDPYMLSIYEERVKLGALNQELEKAKDMRVEYLLKGTYTASDSNYKVHPVLYNVNNGQIAKEWDFEGAEFFPLLDKVTLQIKKDLEVPPSHLENIKDLPLNQQLTESIPAFKKLIQGLGMLSNKTGIGIQLIGEAAKDDETFAYANMIAAMVHHQLSFSREVAEESIDKAMKHRKRLGETTETNVRMLNYRIKGEPEKAVQLAQMMADLRPAQSDLQLSLSQEYQLLGQWEKALDGIKRYQIARDDPDAAIESELNCLLVLNRLSEGIQRGEDFMKRNPEKLNVAKELGKLYLKAREYDKAEPIFKKANLLDPDSPALEKFLTHISFMRDSGAYINEEFLKKYEGDYEVEYRKISLRVKADAPILYMNILNQQDYPFFPTNSHSFFAEMEQLSLKFKDDIKQNAKQMYLSEKGSEFILCFKEDASIKKAHALLTEKKYEEALPLYQAALVSFPDHYYLKNYIRHLQFMIEKQDKWNESFRKAYVGTYSINEKKIQGTVTEKNNNLYLQQANFPGALEPSVILPMSDTEFMIPSSLASIIVFDKKSNKVRDISLLLGNRNVGTLARDK